jgi:hydrogenase nickel incorporation protein HypA/HybF
MSEIVRRILEAADEAGATSVTAVDLEIGGLTFLGEGQLDTAYNSLVKGTMAEGSELRIRTSEVEYQCTQCGSTGVNPALANSAHIAPLIECPDCGETAVLTGGKECRVTNIEAEVPDPE